MSRPKRLTRSEQQEATRQHLLDAAEALFAQRGIAATPIEDIAEAAGFSRGAFYSNFADKHALVMVLLRRKAERSNIELADMMQHSSSATNFLETVRKRELDMTRNALLMEFHQYAMHNLDAKPELAAINQASRRLTEQLVTEIWKEIQGPVPVTAELASKVLQSLDDGITTLRLIEPDEFPAGMYTDVVILLHEALVALAEKRNASS